jgi:hypothetical protein
MTYRSVLEVASFLKDKFKIEMNIYDVILNCAEALKELKQYATVKAWVITHVENFCVNLTGVYDVRSVIRLEEPLDLGMDVFIQDLTFPPQVIFEMPPQEEVNGVTEFKNNYIPHIRGPYIDFVWECPKLKFNEDKVKVAINTISIKRDKRGYPMVPEHSFYACAYFCAYAYMWPLFLLGKVEPFVWNELKDTSDRQFAKARARRTLAGLTNNEADKLFNIMVSMDRKAYGLPS